MSNGVSCKPRTNADRGLCDMYPASTASRYAVQGTNTDLATAHHGFAFFYRHYPPLFDTEGDCSD